jgi:subtilase-type serine protease
VATENDLALEGFSEFYNKDNIFVINNSWDEDKTLFEASNNIIADSAKEVAYMDGFWGTYLKPLLEKRDILLIFSTGNYARLNPGMPVGLPSMALGYTLYNGTKIDPVAFSGSNYYVNNIIGVINFNSDYPTDSPFFINPSSNMGDGAYKNTLMAPGTQIISTIPGNEYASLSGTSMAAPHVTGVAALVQEAFPGIEGKQIGDILLSTTTKLQLTSLPFFIIKDNRDLFGIPIDKTFTVYSYTLPSSFNLSDIINTFKTSGDADDFIKVYGYDDSYKLGLFDALSNIVTLQNDVYEKMFGQGVLDAGKAVRGPGYLDAYRLTEANFYDNQVDPKSLLYPVTISASDTWKWLNDISQEQTMTNGDSYPVGLDKYGSGTLELYGKNTYSGITRINDGKIMLSDMAEIAGKLTVYAQGILGGSGKIKNEATINGTLTVGSTLSGSYATVTFEKGLILSAVSNLYFTLGNDSSLGSPTAGIHYDSVNVSGGSFNADGSLIIDGYDSKSGKYVLFDYDGVNNFQYNFTKDDIT